MLDFDGLQLMLRKGNTAPEEKMNGRVGLGRVQLFMVVFLFRLFVVLFVFFLRTQRQLKISQQYRRKTSFDFLFSPEILFKPNPAFTYIVMISAE